MSLFHRKNANNMRKQQILSAICHLDLLFIFIFILLFERDFFLQPLFIFNSALRFPHSAFSPAFLPDVLLGDIYKSPQWREII